MVAGRKPPPLCVHVMMSRLSPGDKWEKSGECGAGPCMVRIEDTLYTQLAGRMTGDLDTREWPRTGGGESRGSRGGN